MIRNLVELSDEVNGRKHSYSCPQDSPCDDVIAYCKVIIEHCEKLKEEAAKNAPAEEAVPDVEKLDETIVEVEDVGCCNG